MQSVDKVMARRVFFLMAGGIFLCWALFNHELFFSVTGKAFSVISPLLAGGAIAFILNVPVRSIERRIVRKGKAGFRRVIAISLAFLLVLLVFALLLLIVIPELVSAIERLAAVLPGLLDSMKLFVTSLGERYPDLGFWLGELEVTWANMKTDVIGLLKQGSAAVVGSTMSLATRLVNGVVDFVLAMVFSIYMLARKEQLSRQSGRILFAYVPEHVAKAIVRAGHLVNKTFSNFVTGALTEAVILGSMFLVTMLIFRFPYAVLVSSLVSIASLIPIVGAFIAALVGMLLMVVSDPMQALWFLVLFLVLQQIEGNLIYPRVVGESVGLGALWVLAAVMIGGSLFGVIGMLLGVPVAAVIHVLSTEMIARRLAQKHLDPSGGVDS
jgi:predicted PurR-regulated permease PerM